MRMKSKVAVGLAAAGIAAGGGGAALATSLNGSDAGTPSQQAFLEDVARRLGVEESALVAALKGAASDQVDAALAAGRITKDEADAIKARIQSGPALPFLGGPGFAFGGHGRGPDFFAAAATYLGVTETQLRTELGSGKTLADLARTAGKTVDGLKTAIATAVKKHLDEDVAARRLTAAQAEELLGRLTAHLDELVNGRPDSDHHPFGPAPGRPAHP